MGSLFWLHKLVGTQCLRETFQMEQRSEGFHFVRCYGPVTVLEVDEDVTDRFTVKITLANGYHGGFVLVQDLDAGRWTALSMVSLMTRWMTSWLD